ncbi:MAG: TRAP transporter TatT component family protein [Candidatus Aminicenantes bacterium]|nr:TRAP transporter TatT component family protein [Candidatus Aminicenantes bacterium]
MKKRLFVLAVTLGFLALSALPGPAQEGKTLIQQGDELYEARADLSKAQEALGKYREAYVTKEDAYGASWRIARAHYWIGDHTPDKAEKKRIFEQGIYYAKKAVEFAPDKPEGHYWLGICYGVYGEAKGVLKSLSLVKPIKAAMNKVLELDPAYDDGGPDRVLGRVYHELPGFAGGSKKKSLEHLLRSKELGPRVGLTRIYLADTYLSLDEVEKAREELEFVLAMEPDAGLAAETAEEKEMARKRLERKEFRKDAPSIPF